MIGNSRPLGRCVCAGVVAFLASTALVTVAVAQPAGNAPPAEPEAPAFVELSDAQLERLAARESVSLLDLNSYVIVVGLAPKLPLFGSKSDLGSETATLGMPTHAEMMAVVTPSPVTQAGGADTLGIVTARAFGVLAPLAVKTVAGWLGGNDDDEPEAVRFAGYTRTVQIGGDVDGRVVGFVLPQGRATGGYFDARGRVVYTRCPARDERARAWRVRRERQRHEGAGRTARHGRRGLHLLTVSPASDAVLDRPTVVDIVVVAYATDG